MFKFGESHPPIELCGVTSASPSLFGNLTTGCHPIVTKSRRFNNADKRFIQHEVEKLLKDHVIEPSSSPWTSQVLVTPEVCRMPFGLTNAVASFQRIMDDLIVSYSLTDIFPYLDNATIGGRTQQEHDENVRRFLEMVTEQEYHSCEKYQSTGLYCIAWCNKARS